MTPFLHRCKSCSPSHSLVTGTRSRTKKRTRPFRKRKNGKKGEETSEDRKGTRERTTKSLLWNEEQGKRERGEHEFGRARPNHEMRSRMPNESIRKRRSCLVKTQRRRSRRQKSHQQIFGCGFRGKAIMDFLGLPSPCISSPFSLDREP